MTTQNSRLELADLLIVEAKALLVALTLALAKRFTNADITSDCMRLFDFINIEHITEVLSKLQRKMHQCKSTL